MKTFLRQTWILACCPTAAVFAQEASTKPIKPVADFDGVIPSTNQDGSTLNGVAHRVQTGELGLEDVFIFILKLIDLVTKIAGSIAVIALLYAGIQFMLSGVTDEKEKAKTTLKYAIMGLVVTFGAWLVINLLMVQLGGKNALLG